MVDYIDDILKSYGSETIERILRSALMLFATATPDAVRMRDIVANAKVNIAAVNYHFKSKDNLYMEVAKIFGYI